MKKIKQIWVVKIGSAVFVNSDKTLNHKVMSDLVEDILYAKSQGIAVVLVTSGAVAAGNISGKFSKGAKAAVGQLQLIRQYRELFDVHNATIAQYLITKEDFSDRKRYICLHSSLEELLAHGVIPIINDNDVLHEARESFSDNDQLAAYLAIMMDAEYLCILSSVDGIYSEFGTENQQKIEFIRSIKQLEDIDVSSKTDSGTGGMKSKLKSLIMMMQSGISSCIADGKDHNSLKKVIDGNASTTQFIPFADSKRNKGIKRWLFAGAEPSGAIWMSEKASEILKQKAHRKSVLLKGVEKVNGSFSSGEVIRVLDSEGVEIGYGVVKISSEEIDINKGREKQVVIHADYFLVRL